jgi:hypothetical protein
MGKTKKEKSWTVRDHENYLLAGYSDDQLAFRIMPRSVLACPAFLHLSGSATKVLVLALNEIKWTVRKNGTHKGRAITVPSKPRPFRLVYGRLEAAGISRPTASRCIRELIALGFLTVYTKEDGKPTIYKLSDRHKTLSTNEVVEIKKSLKTGKKS